MNLNEFKEALVKRNVLLTDKQLEQFDQYAKYLKEYNEKINLTAIDEYEEVLEKHFYDCLLLIDRKLEGTLVDVGSGAGFPGVVLKVALPELKVVLLEPINKRCVFLNSLIERLELKDVEVINARAEDYSLKNREKYDYVTARAVSNLNGLIEVCGALVKKNGYFIALRGKDGLDELDKAQKAISTMGFEIENTNNEHLLDGSTRIISYLKKIHATPTKYPRKYSIIKQHTL
ncbi:MAG: 16S rRNA (guanine(527)-N(7))-methyltransferase RsmG [Erysipelotrichaceae bacterium]|nr:16S rRNA (guanine(527)-N(7))-methyltransferase RsmG [Erysipelotrichaceae bacterium]